MLNWELLWKIILINKLQVKNTENEFVLFFTWWNRFKTFNVGVKFLSDLYLHVIGTSVVNRTIQISDEF